MMKETLAAYSGLTVAALLVSILAFTTLVSFWRRGELGSSFKAVLGIWLWSGAQFIDRAWWTVWKSAYMSRRASAWMIDHWLPLLSPLLMICGMMLWVSAMTEDSPYKRATQLCLGAILGIMFITYLGR